MAVLVGEKLACSKRDRQLFSAVDITAKAGELTYVRGPNGAGKTSLLRILVGLSQPDEGRVFFDGTPISEQSARYQQQLIYFGHKLGINPILSPLENMRFWCHQHAVRVSTEALFDVLGELGLAGLEDLPSGQLSAGQQRRVALSRCWLKRAARVWVLDEPLNALDVDGVALLTKKMQAFLHNQGTIVVTSHQTLPLSCQQNALTLEYSI